MSEDLDVKDPSFISEKSYFDVKEEEAIKSFLKATTSEKEKNRLFQEIIDPCFRQLIKGVLRMPKFQKIIGLDIAFDIEDGAYYNLVFNMHKFDENKIGKDGKPVKAYSYFGTAVKNYVLALKIQADGNIAKYGGKVDVFSIKDKVSYQERDKTSFVTLKKQLISHIDQYKENPLLTKNEIIITQCVKYMLLQWDKLDFQNKNEFVRLLCYYTHLSPNIVASSFKKIKDYLQEKTSLLDTKEYKIKKLKKEKYEEEEEEEIVESQEEETKIEETEMICDDNPIFKNENTIEDESEN
jgi:hypothetical protein